MEVASGFVFLPCGSSSASSAVLRRVFLLCVVTLRLGAGVILSDISDVQHAILPPVPHEPPQTARHPSGPSRQGVCWVRDSHAESCRRSPPRQPSGFSPASWTNGRAAPRAQAGLVSKSDVSPFSPARSPCPHRMQQSNTCAVPGDASRQACRHTASSPRHREMGVP